MSEDIKLCPVCGKELKPVVGICRGFSCITKVFGEYDTRHYYEDSMRIITYVLPYRIMTIKSSCSFIDYLDHNEYPYHWEELTCTSIIQSDTEENLKKRIKNLLLFL